MRYLSDGGVGVLNDQTLHEVGSSDVAVGLRKTIKPVTQHLRKVAANRLTLKLQAVGKRGENWDGRGSAAAKADSVSRAMSIVDALMAQAAVGGHQWKDPLVGLDEHGDVSLEWWNRERKVTLYIAPNATEYLRSWGANMDNEMELEVLEKGVFEALWRWLNHS